MADQNAALAVDLPKPGKTGAVTKSGFNPAPLVPQTVEECWQIAQYYSVSGAVSKSYPGGPGTKENIAAVFGAIQTGASVGLAPPAALSVVMMVNGRFAMYGDGQLGVVRKSGLLEEFTESLEGEEPTSDPGNLTLWPDDYRAVCYAKRKEVEPPISYTFSVLDAKRAGLWGKEGPWRTHPKRMLKYRSRAFTLRDLFPDVLLGLQHSAEELEDVTPLVDDGSGTMVPERPTRAQFEHPQPETTDAETEPEPPQEFELIDQFGEVVGSYSPGTWSDEFDRYCDKCTTVAALSTLAGNNIETAQAVRERLDDPESLSATYNARLQELQAEDVTEVAEDVTEVAEDEAPQGDLLGEEAADD